MLLEVLLALTGFVVVVVVASVALLQVVDLDSPRSDQVMPSHYSSLLHARPESQPGYCGECGAYNDPDYRICQRCSSALPRRRGEWTGDEDSQSLESILDE